MTDGLSCALVDLRRGEVRTFLAGEARSELVDLASVASEIFATDGTAWAQVALPADHEGAVELAEVVVVAPGAVYVAQRVSWDGELALVSIGSFDAQIGIVVAASHAWMRELERQR